MRAESRRVAAAVFKAHVAAENTSADALFNAVLALDFGSVLRVQDGGGCRGGQNQVTSCHGKGPRKISYMRVDHTITYRNGYPLSVEQYQELLNASTLGERRPVNEPDKIASMLFHANLLVSAWDGGVLAGAARCLS
ncbi:MAG: hypothetical protein EG825_16585, partial [Rhodocyclaceae bacterium]|nr:hypothetical protein [Rhodocyclaceae bacterium]